MLLDDDSRSRIIELLVFNEAVVAVGFETKARPLGTQRSKVIAAKIHFIVVVLVDIVTVMVRIPSCQCKSLWNNKLLMLYVVMVLYTYPM